MKSPQARAKLPQSGERRCPYRGGHRIRSAVDKVSIDCRSAPCSAGSRSEPSPPKIVIGGSNSAISVAIRAGKWRNFRSKRVPPNHIVGRVDDAVPVIIAWHWGRRNGLQLDRSDIRYSSHYSSEWHSALVTRHLLR